MILRCAGLCGNNMLSGDNALFSPYLLAFGDALKI
jgi:hypothetical protein